MQRLVCARSYGTRAHRGAMSAARATRYARTTACAKLRLFSLRLVTISLSLIAVALPLPNPAFAEDDAADARQQTNGDATEVRAPVPGKLSADQVEYRSDGTVVASGNVVFESPNLLPDGAVRITADTLTFSRTTGLISCTGNVVVQTFEPPAQFSGSGFEYDTRKSKGKLDDVTGSIAVDFEPDLDLPPSHIFILDGEMTIEAAGKETIVRLEHARISTYPFDDTDMWFQLKEVEFKSGEYIEMKKGSAYIEGFRVMYWPKYHYDFVKTPGMLKNVIPVIGFSGDDGFRIYYYPTIYLGPLATQVNLDYWTERGLLIEFDHYFDLGPVNVGVQHGEVWALDGEGVSAIHEKRYNAYIDGDYAFKNGLIRKIEGRVEYGKIKQITPDLTADRFAGRFDVYFKRKPLGGGNYFAFRTGVKYFGYFDLPTDTGLFTTDEDDFTVFTSAATLGRVGSYGTDKIEFRFNPNRGAPAFRFDDTLNEFEATATKHIPLNKKWLAVGRVLYDFEHSEFDSVTFEFRKLNKAYSVGLAWDFQTNAAQLTLNARFW
jgi:hypothetical protein